MNPNGHAGAATGTGRDGRQGSPALVIIPESSQLRRRLGPLPWMVLQHLALGSHRSEVGWVVAVGVRDVASGIGATKDTAARAVSILVAAGLVARDRVDTPGGRRRSGYLLHLPDTMRLIDCPGSLDGVEGRPAPCPEREYTGPARDRLDRIPHSDTARNGRRRAADDAKPSVEPPHRQTCEQPFLFDAATPEQAHTWAGTTGERP